MPKGNTNTNDPKQTLDAALSGLPADFRRRLVDRYIDLRSELAKGKADTVGMRAAYFAETLIRFLQDHLTGTHTPFGTRITNFTDECRKLEKTTAHPNDEGIRVIMPRALDFLYTLRNKRGMGHVGGDVDANGIDATTCVRIADWCLCELIRVFHSSSLEEAQAILDALTVRELPEIWAVGGKKRVLNSSLDYKSQVLLLLSGAEEASATVEDIQDWIEHPRLANLKNQVLRPLHQARLIEYDGENQIVTISPTGIEMVERQILPKLEQGR
jgi:hypothetical protein